MVSLKDISIPVQSELDAFDTFFRETMKSKVSLLDTIVRYIVKRRGKRVRPLLVFLSAAICGKISKRTFIGGALVELLHTATLVHDDVVDQAEKRRGVASINAVWKNKVAVLVGDYLLSRGFLISIEHEEFAFLKVTSNAVRRLSEGELLQIQKSRQTSMDEETYFRIISDKTASLLSCCCEIGALSTTQDSTAHQALRDYGEWVGLAFQIRDDILDYESKSSILGKPVGNDVKEKKITLPLIYAVKRAPAKEAKAMISIVKSGKASSREISKVIDFVRRYGGIVEAEKKAYEFKEKAQASIRHLPPSEAKNSLLKFADFVITRLK